MLSLTWIVVVAVGFLVVTTAVGVAARAAAVRRASTGTAAQRARWSRWRSPSPWRSPSWPTQAKLAPIVGAFVAGLVLGRVPIGGADPPRDARRSATSSSRSSSSRSESTPTSPQFVHPNVLGMAAVLLAVAIVGKLASAAGLLGFARRPAARRYRHDPPRRGRSHLRHASACARACSVEDVYAALLLVVLVTTLLTPPLLRRRLLGLRAATHLAGATAASAPPEGWLLDANGTIELVSRAGAHPEAGGGPRSRVAPVPMPGPGRACSSWLNAAPPGAPALDARGPRPVLRAAGERESTIVASAGDERSTRASAARNSVRPSLRSDPRASSIRSPRSTGPVSPTCNRTGFYGYRGRPEKLLAAALVVDATGEGSTNRRRGSPRGRPSVSSWRRQPSSPSPAWSTDADLLVAASRRLDGLMEEPVLQLAAHLGHQASRPTRSTLLTLSGLDELDARDRARLATLHDLLLATLDSSRAGGPASALEHGRAAPARKPRSVAPTKTRESGSSMHHAATSSR